MKYNQYSLPELVGHSFDLEQNNMYSKITK